jgi:hypothetical protein
MKSTTQHERLCLARRNYHFSLLMTTAFSLPVLISTLLMTIGQSPSNLWAAASGALPIISCLQLVRDSSDRLDRLLSEFNED